MSYVIKSNGEKEKFNPEKIKRTLIRSGASKKLADELLKKIEKKVYNNIKTREILDLILDNLKKEKGVFERYDLKRAIMELGPTGYPFENFFAIILENYGFNVETNKVLKGKMIDHEVDIIAIKEKSFMIECKYHNHIGVYTRIKIPLYVYARFLDLKNYFDSVWLVTNTKCSNDVKEYAKGVNMRITSWNYPSKESLRDLINQKKLYPITILKHVAKNTKEKLFKANIFLLKTLAEKDIHWLRKKTNLSEQYLYNLISEAKVILDFK